MDSDYKVLSPRFREYLLHNTHVEKLFTGSRWAEGPVYFADGDYLVWSDIPNNRMLRWTEETGTHVFRKPSNYSNGNTRDRQGRLVTCEHGARRVTRTEHDGRITVLADQYQGKKLNSPNDVVVKSDDSVWFTDPPYGILGDYEGHKSPQEQPKNHVYRLDGKTGALEVVADDFDKPNGLAFSPDEKILYIADTGLSHNPKGAHHIRAFEVVDGRKLGKGKVLAVVDPGVADGFRVDTDGNIWTSAGDGVHCISPQGKLLGKVLIPETVSNVTFGGPKKNRLFITGTTSLYSVYLNRRGVQTP